MEFTGYDPAWPGAFEGARTTIVDVVPAGTVIEHIGSTSIPGMPAKPIIDIMIVTAEPDAVIAALETIGHEHRPGSFADEPGHTFLRLVRHGRRIHHVHLLDPDSPRVAQYRRFRDYLRADPRAAQQYAEAKRDLAARHDRSGYLAEKPAVVDGLMDRAWRWQG